MSRTIQDIERMTLEDTDIGLNYGHYKPMEKFIKERNYKRGIEIGTAYGGLANHLLSTCDLELLICIDPYKFYPDMPGLFDQEDYDMMRESAYKRLSRYRAYSGEYRDSKDAFEFLSFIYVGTPEGINPLKHDFVFIDGLHKYETIKWECEHYSKLLREGGALMGHDYNVFEDVNRAVDEFAKGKERHLLPGNVWYLNY